MQLENLYKNTVSSGKFFITLGFYDYLLSDSMANDNTKRKLAENIKNAFERFIAVYHYEKLFHDYDADKAQTDPFYVVEYLKEKAIEAYNTIESAIKEGIPFDDNIQESTYIIDAFVDTVFGDANNLNANIVLNQLISHTDVDDEKRFPLFKQTINMFDIPQINELHAQTVSILQEQLTKLSDDYRIVNWDNWGNIVGIQFPTIDKTIKVKELYEIFDRLSPIFNILAVYSSDYSYLYQIGSIKDIVSGEHHSRFSSPIFKNLIKAYAVHFTINNLSFAHSSPKETAYVWKLHNGTENVPEIMITIPKPRKLIGVHAYKYTVDEEGVEQDTIWEANGELAISLLVNEILDYLEKQMETERMLIPHLRRWKQEQEEWETFKTEELSPIIEETLTNFFKLTDNRDHIDSLIDYLSNNQILVASVSGMIEAEDEETEQNSAYNLMTHIYMDAKGNNMLIDGDIPFKKFANIIHSLRIEDVRYLPYWKYTGNDMLFFHIEGNVEDNNSITLFSAVSNEKINGEDNIYDRITHVVNTVLSQNLYNNKERMNER